jgi:putative MATE family efflux protein
MANSKYEMDMCSGPLLSKLIAFAVPLMLSGILQLMFNAVDLIVVGRFSGSTALAAVGSTTALISVFINLFMGVSQGTNVLVAQSYAAGKKKDVSNAVHTSILVAAVSGVFMAVLGQLLSEWALECMGTPENVIDQSVLYMKIYFLGMPFFMLYNYGAAILRGVGDTRRPLIFLVISGVVNAGLNVFLVAVFHLGVAGVAIATVVSQCISCVLVMLCLIRTEADYRFCLRELAINGWCLKKILQVGIPAGVQGTVINFSNVLLQSSVNSFGSTSMAGYTAANNILGFLYASVNAVTQTCMSFTSQNYGGGQWKRMNLVLLECLGITAVLAAVLGYGSYFLGPQLLQIYTDEPKVVTAAMEILSYTTTTYFICGIMDLFPGAMRGMGYSLAPMILSVVGTVGTRLVWIYIFFPRSRSLDFLFISYPASWIFTVAMQAACYLMLRKMQKRKFSAHEV